MILAPFRSLERKIEDFYSVASILMPCSEVESGYGINFDATKENFPRSLYFLPSHDLPLERDFKILFGSTHKIGLSQSSLSEGIYRNRPITKNFPGTLKKALSNGLTSGGVPQEHPIPSPDKEVITTRQLNNRHRNRYDLAITGSPRKPNGVGFVGRGGAAK